MAQSIRNIVTLINQELEGIFKGSKLYGVATSVEREGKTQPVVDELPVSFDDSYSLQAYHKANKVTVYNKQGFGDKNNTINSFDMSLFVFDNEKRLKLKSDEVAMIIQQKLSTLLITSVSISVLNIILNTQTIYATEYRGSSPSLGEYTSLMQMNYTVEITFKSGCFDLCPEDFSPCKN